MEQRLVGGGAEGDAMIREVEEPARGTVEQLRLEVWVARSRGAAVTLLRSG